nr:ribonuclease H-like domain-containing protein [Tanacetum cinerariifolium]
PPTQHHHLCRCPATFYTTVAIAATSSPLPHCHQLTPLTPTTATTTTATAAAFPADAAVVAGCGWKISHHRRGAVRHQTTIVVAVGRRYSRTFWCRAVMAQPLGIYHQKNVDYVYLLWEDLVYQIENKVSKRNKDIYYPRFIKIIINHFMSQDLTILRRNRVDWHMALDDYILTTMRFIPQHKVVQKYGVILPDNLTNRSMKESEAYKTYYAFATRKAIPKPKYVRRAVKEKTVQAPKASPGKRIKSTAKVTRSGKKKQIAEGLETLSKIALSEKSSDEEDDNDETNLSKDEDDDDQGDDDEQTDSDNDGDDFIHPKFSTHDKEDKKEDSFDPRVQTPFHVGSIDDEDNDEDIQGVNVEGDNKEETNEEENVKSKSDKGYHAVPSPYTGNYIPPKPDLMFIDEQVKSESVDVASNVTSSDVKTVMPKHESVDVKNKGVYNTVETKSVRKNSFSPPIIEDWISDDESKAAREKVEKVETPKQHKHYPRGNQRNWNNLMSQRLRSNFKVINKACYVCGSFEHLQYDCDKRVVRPVWNNSRRVNHKNSANKLTHPHPKRNFVPRAVLMTSGQVSLNTRQTVNSAKPVSNFINRAHSTVRRPFNQRTAFKNRNINQKVNVVKRNSVNTVVGNKVYAIKVSLVYKGDHRLKALEDSFSEFKQTNQFVEAVSSIPGIVDTFLANKINEAIKTVVQLQSDKLKDKDQAKNEDFINKLDENIKKIIKEQVKEQVKAQVSKILLKIEKTVNEQLETKVLTRTFSESKTSHAVAANLSELELKRILIDKMERNKLIHKSYEQKNLYKTLVAAYEYEKLILDTYRDIVTIKRRRDDQDEDEEPSARSKRGSKRRRAGKEPESTNAPKEKTSKSTGKSKEGSKSHQEHTSKSTQEEEPIHASE